MGRDAVLDYAHLIHDKFMAGHLKIVRYVDYDPGDQPPEFVSNVAERFGYPVEYNDVIRRALMRLEEMHVVDIEENLLDEDDVPESSDKLITPKRKKCVVTLC